MPSVLQRVAEARREQRARDWVEVRVDYTISPLRRVMQISRGRLRVGFGLAFSLLCSLLAHLAAAVLVVLIPISLMQTEPPPDLHAALVEEELLEEPAEPNFDLAQPSKDPHENVLAALAASQAPVYNAKVPLERVIVPTTVERFEKAPAPLEGLQPLEGMKLDRKVARPGSVGEEVMHVEGAVDRITHEIARNLEEKNVIVVWLMDASISLIPERKLVAENLERVFSELDRLDTAHKDDLVNAVVSYAETPKPLVEPTSDAKKVVEAIRSVATDESGIENVFSAVQFAIDRYKSRITQQRRKMMIVIWTDESGDDYRFIDPVIGACQRLSISVYTVGPSSMFGKELGTRPFVHDNGQTYYLPLNRGPESVHQEQVELPFWFAGPQYENLHSGLGPFGLTRLACDTGGMYFLKDDPRDVSPFRIETMLRYAPEYDSVSNYIRRVQTSPLRRAIMQAVEVTRQRKLRDTPRLQFAPTGNTFQQELQEAQQTAAYNLGILEAALAPFGRGMENEYEKEKSSRWRAWFDLNYGRLLAMNVRNYEYNWACAVMKGKGREFVDQKSNRWKFTPHEKINFGSGTQKQAADAIRLLTRCIDQNPGTPWALFAQRELRYPLGFKVEEAYVAPPPPPKPQPVKPNPKVKPPIVKPPPKEKLVEQPKMLPRPEQVKLPRL